jgi:hypothetical protein
MDLMSENGTQADLVWPRLVAPTLSSILIVPKTKATIGYEFQKN